MNPKEKDFRSSLKQNLKFQIDEQITPQPAAVEPTGTPAEEPEIKATWKIRADYLELVRREAYWNRTDDKEVVNAALGEYFAGKTYDPIPPTAKRNRGGRPRKR
jgi:hypothetical protein